MTDRMREAFEKWNNGPDSLTFYNCWQAAWQAAQSVAVVGNERTLLKPAQIGATRFGVGVKERLVIDRAQREYEHRQLEAQPVAVVGEPWRWIVNKPNGEPLLSLLTYNEAERYLTDGFIVFPVYLRHSHSITAAELEALRKNAERYQWLRDSPESPIINIGYATDKMVDAAIAGEK